MVFKKGNVYKLITSTFEDSEVMMECYDVKYSAGKVVFLFYYLTERTMSQREKILNKQYDKIIEYSRDSHPEMFL